jgi:MFS superfamily sulfate permease-like transporter
LAEFDHEFNAKVSDRGSKSFMTLTELHDPINGFLVNDACIIGVEIFIRKSTHEKQVNQTVNLTVNDMEVETHSSSRDADAELVFGLLGRVLYFLNNRKVKDMNEQACKELQDLWDELKKFKYDLTWLEPHVQSALGMKSYVERAMEVEKLKENVVVLKLETEKLEAKLVAAKLNLEVERDLLKGKGFKEMDLDSELGCGSWKP